MIKKYFKICSDYINIQKKFKLTARDFNKLLLETSAERISQGGFYENN